MGYKTFSGQRNGMMSFRKKQRNTRRKEPFIKRIVMTLKSRGAVRIFKAGVCLVFALLIVFGSLHIYHELLKSPYLAIKEIKVGGNMRVSRAEILELAGVNIGDNLLEINAADIKKGIRVNPWVSEVNVARNFPDRLNIEIKEGRPVAFINLDGLYLVDENGKIFKKTSMGDDIDLPIITGLTRGDIEAGGKTSELAIKAINLIHLLSKNGIFTHDELSEINIDKTYGLTLYTMQQGTRIEIGEEDFTEKLARLERIIQSRNGLADVEFIGLNYNRGVVVRLAS
ncbi:MAG: FtsQ-type POTRA domain-containing protein [Deltaproteobacteria bacterium]